MPHHHHPVFVAFSLAIAVFGSWTALGLFRRVRSHIGHTRQAWLGMTAVAMGVGIWSMHFVAMLGFDPGVPVTYDPALTILSLALAVVATWGAFFAAARERAGPVLVVLAGVAMGAGICGMHYMGMAAMQGPVQLSYDPPLVALSLLVAVSAATAALFATRRERSLAWRAGAAIVLGLAIAGMHYTGMAALDLDSPNVTYAAGSAPYGLAAGVTAGALLILGLSLMAAFYDQRLNVMAALDAGGVGYWELVLPSRTLHLSSRGKALLELGEEAPFSLDELLALLPPESEARQKAALDRAIATREEFEAEIRLPEPTDGVRWVSVRGRVVGPAGAPVRRMVGVLFDVTERQEAFAAVAASERRQRLLIDELNHRVKNTLAAVQSISRQSAKRAGSLDDFRALFESRLIALSQTHNALTRTAWQHAHLTELLLEQLGPYAADQVELKGDDVELSPKEALALGMVFHELATNAAKYGALSAAMGVVRVAWTVEQHRDGPALDLSWTEEGGPPVDQPARRGFGLRMVQGSVTGELGGEADVVFAPEGFRCRLIVPLRTAEDQAA